MYKGCWIINETYSRGDIVYSRLGEYFICTTEHISTHLTFPVKEDIYYWLCIDYDFLVTSVNCGGEDIKGGDIDNVNDATIKGKGIGLRGKTKGKGGKDVKASITDFVPRKVMSKRIKLLINDVSSDSNSNSNSDDVGVDSYKRKLRDVEKELTNHKRRKTGNEDVKDLRDKLMLLDIDIETKSYIVDKYDITEKMSGSDHSKNIAWLKTVANLPYGKYKQLGVSKDDSQEKLAEFFNNVKRKLDKSILGLDNVKQEILEFVARKITNPSGKGHVLALCGVKGVGKTKIIKSLADALDLPFYQINFGGLNDVSILTGHSETYVGSKPGKIVEIISNAQYMNPIIYFDELDKISERKAIEINGILTHMLDEEQNDKFQDNYLSNVNINLSKVFFVIAFNDITKVDEIVSDRMTVIYVNSPSLDEKVKICQEKMIPEIVKSVHFKDNYIIRMDKEIIEYVIFNKITKEDGVRHLKKTIEKIMYKLNYDILINNLEKLKIEKDNEHNIVVITKKYIDQVLPCQDDHNTYSHMYI